MSEQAQIREARKDDAPRLYEIDQLCFPDFMAYSWPELLFFLLHPWAVTRVADVAGSVAGFTVGRVTSRSKGHVITLDVIPEARRQKIGTLLMSALHGEFSRRGVTRSVLEVDTLNEAAQQFYLKMGYKQCELLPGYYRNRRDAYRMLRRL